MPTVNATRLIKLPRKQVYQLLMDIEKYPQFIPFIHAVRIVEKEGKVTVADINVGFRLFTFSYRCRIEETPYDEINIRDVSGPFKYLKAKLTFEEKGKNETLVGYYFSSQFRSGAMNAVADPFFNLLLRSTLEGVEKYALRRKK